MVLREQTPEEHSREQALADVMTMYIDAIAHFRPLNQRRFETARAWIRNGRVYQGQDILLHGSFGVCVRVADRYRHSGVDPMSLISAANDGLLATVVRYEPILDCTFPQFCAAVVDGVTEAVEAEIRGHFPDLGLAGDREPRTPLPPDEAGGVALELPDDD